MWYSIQKANNVVRSFQTILIGLILFWFWVKNTHSRNFGYCFRAYLTNIDILTFHKNIYLFSYILLDFNIERQLFQRFFPGIRHREIRDKSQDFHNVLITTIMNFRDQKSEFESFLVILKCLRILVFSENKINNHFLKKPKSS